MSQPRAVLVETLLPIRRELVHSVSPSGLFFGDIYILSIDTYVSANGRLSFEDKSTPVKLKC